MLYRIADGPVTEAITALRKLAEHNIDAVQSVIDGYFTAMDGLEPVSSEELFQRLRDGTVTLIDVRPSSEYQAGHLPEALSVPIEELEARIGDLGVGREIVAYCRGPYCVLSFEAVRRLREMGIPARRLADGLPEWRAAGLPVVA